MAEIDEFKDFRSPGSRDPFLAGNRQWREELAGQLCGVGVAANATPRFVRGETRPRKPDGIYRAARRGASSHLRERVEAAAVALRPQPAAGADRAGVARGGIG